MFVSAAIIISSVFIGYEIDIIFESWSISIWSKMFPLISKTVIYELLVATTDTVLTIDEKEDLNDFTNTNSKAVVSS